MNDAEYTNMLRIIAGMAIGIVIGIILGHYLIPSVVIHMPPTGTYTFDLGDNAMKLYNLTR